MRCIGLGWAELGWAELRRNPCFCIYAIELGLYTGVLIRVWIEPGEDGEGIEG